MRKSSGIKSEIKKGYEEDTIIKLGTLEEDDDPLIGSLSPITASVMPPPPPPTLAPVAPSVNGVTSNSIVASTTVNSPILGAGRPPPPTPSNLNLNVSASTSESLSVIGNSPINRTRRASTGGMNNRDVIHCSTPRNDDTESCPDVENNLSKKSDLNDSNEKIDKLDSGRIVSNCNKRVAENDLFVEDRIQRVRVGSEAGVQPQGDPNERLEDGDIDMD